MPKNFKTVEDYLASLPPDRRDAIQAVREVILKNLDDDYTEGIQYGMIGYFVPHSIYPPGYHCDPKQPLPFAGLASQKNHMAIYLMCVYGNATLDNWLRDEWAKTGKKLDMLKSCIRFKKLADLPVFSPTAWRFLGGVPAKKFIADFESQIAKRGTARKVPAKRK